MANLGYLERPYLTQSNRIKPKDCLRGVGEMAQHLRALAALPEDSRLTLSTYTVAVSQQFVTPVPGYPKLSLTLLGSAGHRLECRQNMHTQLKRHLSGFCCVCLVSGLLFRLNIPHPPFLISGSLSSVPQSVFPS